jgi:hypothetical protein
MPPVVKEPQYVGEMFSGVGMHMARPMEVIPRRE